MVYDPGAPRDAHPDVSSDIAFGILSYLGSSNYHNFVAQYMPCILAVYASTVPLPVPSQDSLRGVWLRPTPTGLSPARHRQLVLAHSNLVYAAR